MEYSDTFKTTIRFLSTSSYAPTYSSGSIGFGTNTIYNRLLIIDLNTPIIKVPLFVLNNFTDSNSCKFNNVDEVAIPLFCCSYTTQVSGGGAILKHLSRCNGEGLCKAKTKDNKVYHGASGIITDASFDPIILWGAKCRREGNHIVETGDMYIEVPNSIFLNQDDPLIKVIIKKVIPYTLERKSYYSTLAGPRSGANVEVIVSDHIATKVAKPDINSMPPVKDFLLENIDLVLDQLKI